MFKNSLHHFTSYGEHVLFFKFQRIPLFQVRCLEKALQRRWGLTTVLEHELEVSGLDRREFSLLRSDETGRVQGAQHFGRFRGGDGVGGPGRPEGPRA